MITNEDKVKNIISKILKVKKESIFLEDDLQGKFNMDSMQRVEIIIELEKTFDAIISDEIAATLRTPQQILRLLEETIKK
jgi:acyl carrier protein